MQRRARTSPSEMECESEGVIVRDGGADHQAGREGGREGDRQGRRNHSHRKH